MSDGWIRIFEGDVWRSHMVQAQLESEGVPAMITEPQCSTPNPEIDGMPNAAASVWVRPEREREAREILANPPPVDAGDDDEA
jgi:hypothetical protein